MKQLYYIDQFAQSYGGGEYGECAYQQNTPGCETAAGGTSGGGLANTGVAVAGIVTLAAIILLVAVLVRWWRRPRELAAEVAIDKPQSSDAERR